MDFMNRGNRPVQQNTQTPDSSLGAPKAPSAKSDKPNKSDKWSKVGAIAFLAAVAILIVAVVLSLVFVKDNRPNEESYVNHDQLQAVFLNGGQVYFGKISDLNSQYMTLDNIYYLRVNQQVQPNQQNSATPSANDISLVKLGCELHGPQDSMVINRDQIIFWENLKGDGQVAKAVDEYVKANPDGQKCDQNNNNNANSGNTSNNNANTNNTTNNTGNSSNQ